MPGLRTSGRVESCWRARVAAESERRRLARLAGAGWKEERAGRRGMAEGSGGGVDGGGERSVNPGSISARRPTNLTSTPDSLPPPADLPDLSD